MSFPRYPKYKDSGVDSLEEVPDCWDVLQIRALASCNDDVLKESTDRNQDIAYVDISGVDSTTGRISATTMRFADAPTRARRRVRANDLLVPTVVSTTDTFRRAIALIRTPVPSMVVSTGFAVLRPNSRVVPEFLNYLLLSDYLADAVVSRAVGISLSAIGTDELLRVKVGVPTIAEQLAVVRFLDRETRTIDALVSEQQRLIELLREKRQSFISHAVTQGIARDAPKKQSGIEWVGSIPKHWTTVSLGKLCRSISDGPHFSPPYVDEGVPFLSARNVRVDRWALDDVKYISERLCDEFDRRVVPELGDILYTKGGTTGIARLVDLPYRFQVWVHIAVLKLRTDIVDPEFLAVSLNSAGAYEQSQLYTHGATNQDLGLTRMVRIRLALPPIPEQREIARHVNSGLTAIDSLIDETVTSIALLQQRRRILISAAVTGKIDVRNYAADQTAAA